MFVGQILASLAILASTGVQALPGPPPPPSTPSPPSPPSSLPPPPGPSSQADPAIAAALGNDKSRPLPTNNASFACQVLAQAFGSGDGTASPSSGQRYTAVVDENYSATCWLSAQCVVSPKTSTEVARTVAILAALKIKFSIRSGGHKQTPGFAGVGSDGVLISLSNLKRIDLAGDKSVVNVGPGNQWQDVYNALEPSGLTVTGGRAGIVGVGGFLLGGGLSYFANKYGLGVDNVKSYEVVLGSGKIVTASATQNQDLFQGLRGGAANFGIVTNYEMNTIPVAHIYYEGIIYPISASDAVLNATAAWQAKGQLDQNAAITTNYDLANGIIETLLLYSGTSPARPATFDPFYAVGGYQQLVAPTNGTLSSLATLAAGSFAPEGIRTYGETFSNKVNAEFMVEAFEIYRNMSALYPAGVNATWVPAPISVSMAKYGQNIAGGNLLGLQAIPQQWHEWYVVWTDASLDQKVYQVSSQITDAVTAAAKKHGADVPYLFMNTAGTNQKVLQSFGDANVRKIKNAAAKYDPNQVFQKLQNKGYLVRDL